ncbi:MAG: hypothetical protein FOGNACKC_04670 [Anaerolineae bacterium]|nr:hypothetical protein [Anaerolineae bacterium]
MKLKLIAVLLVAVLSAISLSGPAAVLAQKPTPPAPNKFLSGEVVVKFKPQIGQRVGKDRLERDGLKIAKTLPRSGLIRIRVAPGAEQETIARLLARGDVEFATLNYIVQAFETPNDPGFGSQWGMTKIEAPSAWNISHGSAAITIAVIDTGVDLDHPDLAGKLWVNTDEIPANGLDDDFNGYIDDVNGYDFYNLDAFPDDDNSHGSHVAGIAAAATNNGVGVAGVSWGAKIMALKALNYNGNGSTADLAEAVYYAVDNGAKVINMSLGIPWTSWPCNYPDIETAFTYAVNHNVLLVVAAGNDGKYGVSCPGAYDQAMAVGSTDSSDNRSSFSNYGPRLDIAAPGSSIYSTWSNGTYGTKSGTSMATPHVAGLAALVWGMAPNMTAAQVRQAIESTADDLGPPGWDIYYGYGRINAFAALKPFAALTLSTANGSPLSGPLTFLTDDTTAPIPAETIIGVNTTLPDPITWTATISPAVTWLNMSASSGQVSASSASQFGLTATRPASYGLYTTNVVVTGTTAGGLTVGPVAQEVRISYVSKLLRYYFPLFFKN